MKYILFYNSNFIKKLMNNLETNTKKNLKIKRKKTGRPVKGSHEYLLSKEELIKLYKQMLLIRRFEEKAGQLYGMGSIGGFCHLYIGQEAVVVGMQSVSLDGDSVITSYRDHGHMLACGMDPKGVMAELTGRESGYSKGKGGPVSSKLSNAFLFTPSSTLKLHAEYE